MKLPSGNNYKVIGVMSGTSLDGLDLAAVTFQQDKKNWNFLIAAGETVSYTEEWQNKLKNAPTLPGEKLIELHSAYGRFTGHAINRFIQSSGFSPGLIASHGHTVFHQPEKQFTFQLGNGAAIAAETGITTVADFRTADVSLGGQGAPLVPAGDRLLFSEYAACLNLGGFANISFEKNQKRIAYDICPVNFILNYLAGKNGLAYDEDGKISRSGKVDTHLLEQLNQLSFYRQRPPKSLCREWMNTRFFPVINHSGIPNNDKLRTVCEHIALQIARETPEKKKMLVTGGGTFNIFLMELIKKHSSAEIIIPSKKIIDFKEALIFAFLGLLRFLGEINCYGSVTGATKDSSSGVIFPVS